MWLGKHTSQNITRIKLHKLSCIYMVFVQLLKDSVACSWCKSLNWRMMAAASHDWIERINVFPINKVAAVTHKLPIVYAMLSQQQSSKQQANNDWTNNNKAYDKTSQTRKAANKRMTGCIRVIHLGHSIMKSETCHNFQCSRSEIPSRHRQFFSIK